MHTVENTPFTRAHLAVPALGSGALVAAYLWLRPYGDADLATMAAALASPSWATAHLLGAGGLALAGVVGLRAARLTSGWPAALARGGAAFGIFFTTLYYGAEAIGLNLIGRHALATGDPGVLAMVEQAHTEPVGLTIFGVGLAALAASGVGTAVAWQRSAPTGRAAAWPFALTVAAVLPQFFLPPTGRVLFGAVHLAAAAVLAVTAGREVVRLASAGALRKPRPATA